jgi:hypothetical protein
MTGKLKLSFHARQRMNQRRINRDEMNVVLQYGRQSYRSGIKFIFLGRRDLPAGLARQYDHLIGTTILIAGQEVITIYKNLNAMAVIRRKSKRDFRKKR